MLGGLKFLGKDPIFFAKQIAYLYENALSENGVMLISLPSFMESLIPEWVDLANISGLKAVYDPMKAALLIERVKNSPEKLPLLSASSIIEIYRETRPGMRSRRIWRVFYQLARGVLMLG